MKETTIQDTGEISLHIERDDRVSFMVYAACFHYLQKFGFLNFLPRILPKITS